MTSCMRAPSAGFRWVCLVTALIGAPATTAAQPDPTAGWPTRPIRLILPSAAGGAGDITSRLVGNKLSERLGQQVIVDNRPGGNGIIGSTAVARAAPDGYTIGLVTASTHAASPALTRNMPYDAKDFAPISSIGNLPIVIASYPGVPAKTIQEFIALARSKPKALNSAWAATMPYLAALVFCNEAGIELSHVPYKGSGQAAIDLIAGRIDLQFGTISPILSLIRAGKLRALAVTSAKRTHSLPDVPSVSETVLPGFDSSLWLAFAAPAGTPAPIVDRLNREIREIMIDPEMQAAFAKNGVDAESSSVEQLSAKMSSDIAKFRAIVAKVGIQLE